MLPPPRSALPSPARSRASRAPRSASFSINSSTSAAVAPPSLTMKIAVHFRDARLTNGAFLEPQFIDQFARRAAVGVLENAAGALRDRLGRAPFLLRLVKLAHDLRQRRRRAAENGRDREVPLQQRHTAGSGFPDSAGVFSCGIAVGIEDSEFARRCRTSARPSRRHSSAARRRPRPGFPPSIRGRRCPRPCRRRRPVSVSRRRRRRSRRRTSSTRSNSPPEGCTTTPRIPPSRTNKFEPRPMTKSGRLSCRQSRMISANAPSLRGSTQNCAGPPTRSVVCLASGS